MLAIPRSLKSRKDGNNKVFESVLTPRLKIQLTCQRLSCRTSIVWIVCTTTSIYLYIQRAFYPAHGARPWMYLIAGYKYVRSICLLMWKGRLALFLAQEALPRAILSSILSSARVARTRASRAILALSPRLLSSSVGYFSLLQPGLRILVTCHCPRNNRASDRRPCKDNISLGHPRSLLSSKYDRYCEIIFATYLPSLFTLHLHHEL